MDNIVTDTTFISTLFWFRKRGAKDRARGVYVIVAAISGKAFTATRPRHTKTRESSFRYDGGDWERTRLHTI